MYMKTCTRCKERQSEFSFTPDTRNKDGLSTVCKRCRANEPQNRSTWADRQMQTLNLTEADYSGFDSDY